MRLLRQNLVVRFSVVSFVIMLVLLIASWTVVYSGHEHVIGDLQQIELDGDLHPSEYELLVDILEDIRANMVSGFVIGAGGLGILYLASVTIVWGGVETDKSAAV